MGHKGGDPHPQLRVTACRSELQAQALTGEDPAAARCFGRPLLSTALCLTLVIMLPPVTAQGQAHSVQPLPL